MEKISVEKLLKAGYVFLRKDDCGGSMKNEPIIKYSDTFGAWRTFQRFATKRARDMRLYELLREPNYLM